ncbi:MAG: hypothetical protein ACHQHN_11830 [Sphingobacteriales bacterium]
MKKNCTFLFFWLTVLSASAQNYNNILNYNNNGTPVNGIKIKTNLPFTPGTQMPTITIQGFNYGSRQTIGLTLVYYIYSGGSNFYDPANYYFYTSQITSFGTYAPPVSLSNENGYVVIYINDRPYYQRFTVSVYAQGMSEQAGWFQGWSAADETLTGTKTVLVPYATTLAGDITVPGNGLWSSNGNLSLGTTDAKGYMLAVNGNIHSRQVNVDLNGWNDYVFNRGYRLKTLSAISAYIDKNHHLPDIPSGQEMIKNGLDVGEMNKLLMKKVEELTLYLIENDKQMTAQNAKLAKLGERNIKQQRQINELLSAVKSLTPKPAKK